MQCPEWTPREGLVIILDKKSGINQEDVSSVTSALSGLSDQSLSGDLMQSNPGGNFRLLRSGSTKPLSKALNSEYKIYFIYLYTESRCIIALKPGITR